MYTLKFDKLLDEIDKSKEDDKYFSECLYIIDTPGQKYSHGLLVDKFNTLTNNLPTVNSKQCLIYVLDSAKC